MPDNNESKNTSNNVVLKTVAGVVVGAAVALGAYFLGKADGQEEAHHSYQNRINKAESMTPKSTFDPANCPVDDDKIFSECNICRRSFKEVMSEDEEIHSTQCGHIFCKVCIHKSIENRRQCPICNSNIVKNQTHRIYL